MTTFFHSLLSVSNFAVLTLTKVTSLHVEQDYVDCYDKTITTSDMWAINLQ
jgi:hypothetical protein